MYCAGAVHCVRLAVRAKQEHVVATAIRVLCIGGHPECKLWRHVGPNARSIAVFRRFPCALLFLLATLPLARCDRSSFGPRPGCRQPRSCAGERGTAAAIQSSKPTGQGASIALTCMPNDRPAGRELRVAIRGLWVFERRGNRLCIPLATLTAIETHGNRWRQCGRCGDCRERLSGILGADQCRDGRGLLRHDLGSEIVEGRELGRIRDGRRNPLSLDTVRKAAQKDSAIPSHGAVSVSTPGALDAWWTLHQRYGKLKWAELFQPAIRLCESGVPVPQIIGYYIGRNLAAFGTSRLRRQKKPPMPCTTYRTQWPSARRRRCISAIPILARTYRMVADGGRDAFYSGRSREPSMPFQAHRRTSFPTKICAISMPNGAIRWCTVPTGGWRSMQWAPTLRDSPPCKC